MEPWLRGTQPHPDPVIRAVFHSFEQVREDLKHWTANIRPEQVWQSVHGLAPLGFQLRHIAGSVDRLTSYAAGQQISEPQLEFLRNEMQPGATLDELLAGVEDSLRQAELAISKLTEFGAPREVGRQKRPTTVGGLLVHVAEHTQRHLGQAIVTCKLLTV